MTDLTARGIDKTAKKHALLLLISLVTLNVIVWIMAFVAFAHRPGMIGMSLLAWSFGLRHAVDADHIAAIDNTTRKMMQQGKRPVSIGTFFAAGHSTVVILAAIAIAATVGAFKSHIPYLANVGGIVGTVISAVFLLIMAYINLTVFLSVHKAFRKVKKGEYVSEEEIDSNVAAGGPLYKIFQFAFKLVNKTWHMYFVGFLFGLGFDTATEIGLLAIAATQATHGMNIWLIMIFPALFTAGMSLIDTLDNFVMVGAYGWAFSKPQRKLYYNMTITGVSVVIALIIGGLEALGELSSELHLSGGFWNIINGLNNNWSCVGGVLVMIFIACWVYSILNYKLRGYDNIMDSPSA